MPTDEQLIQSGIEAARTETRAVDDATARAIAGQLHGGQSTALYSLVSTGNLTDDRLAAELRELSRDPDPQVRDWADPLTTYTQHREQRGPVEGWSQLWPSRPPPVPVLPALRRDNL